MVYPNPTRLPHTSHGHLSVSKCSAQIISLITSTMGFYSRVSVEILPPMAVGLATAGLRPVYITFQAGESGPVLMLMTFQSQLPWRSQQ